MTGTASSLPAEGSGAGSDPNVLDNGSDDTANAINTAGTAMRVARAPKLSSLSCRRLFRFLIEIISVQDF
jgi:hypothetical protein